MRFAHISDLHLCVDPAANPAVNDDANIMAERLVQDIGRIREGLDFVIMTGDLTDDAAPASFALFENLFRHVGLPLMLVPGNHDGPAGFLEYGRHSGQFAQWDISGRVVELGKLRLLGINTCVEGDTTGAIPASSLDLLQRELDAETSAQLLIVMHHPPFMPGLREFDEISVLAGSDRFADILRTARTPPVILCGHVHRPYVASLNGAQCFVGGSPARQFAASPPFGTAAIRPSNEQFSYFVHWTEGASHHVMTPRWIGG